MGAGGHVVGGDVLPIELELAILSFKFFLCCQKIKFLAIVAKSELSLAK